MGTRTIKVPDLGEGIAEVELVAWHVHPGDTVAEDQVLADVMTDKATVEVPSPVAGKVQALGGEVGQTLAVGAELIRIEVEGDAGAPAPAPAAREPVAPAPAAREPAKEGAPAREAAGAPAPAKAAPAKAAPARATRATVPPPSSAAPPPARATPAPAAAASAAAPAPATRPIASPAVRARAWELGIELAQVTASGTAGRIVQADLDAYVASGAPRTRPAAAAERTRAGPASPGGTQVVKVIGLRRRIAQKMQESKRRIPHYTYVEEVDVSELEATRARLNTRFAAERGRLTLLPFLVRALVLGVREVPQVNARFDDETGELTLHDAVHVGIATQTDAGLLVPVLRDAAALDLWAAAAEIARLAESARRGRAVRDELTGSTITLTSLGALGGIVSTPVINHPEVAIVGVNRIVTRPAWVGGAVVPRQLMNLSSSFDHRVVDGAVAAAFVQHVRMLLEHPAELFVE